MLRLLLIVALALAIAAPFAQALAWRVPFSMLSLRMVVRAVLGTSISTLLVGLLAAGCFAVLPLVPDPRTPTTVAGVAAGVGAALLLLSVTRMRQLRGALLLAHRLQEPSARSQALDALRARLDSARPRKRDGNWGTFASLVLVVVGPLTQAGLWDEAEQWLTEPPDGSLESRQSALRAQALATCRLQRGDTEGAWHALQPLSRPFADPTVEAWLRTTEALLFALQENPDKALELVGERAIQDDPSLRASRRVARAHALAAQGQEERARNELREVQREAGAPGLERAMQPEGPASEIARTVRDASDVPDAETA